MEEHPTPPSPSADSNNLRPAAIIPPLPSGFLWRAFPMSHTAAIYMAFVLLYISYMLSHAISMNYPISVRLGELILPAIISAPGIFVLFLILWFVPYMILRLICRLRFKDSHKPYVIEFSFVILMILYLCGSTIYDNIDRPAKSLQRCLMNGNSLPASVKNVEHYYSKGPNSDFLGMWTFEINPAELNKLLQSRQYLKTKLDNDFTCMYIPGYLEFPDKSKLPSVPMTQCFSYPSTDGQEKPSVLYTEIFTDATGSKIVVVQYCT